MSKDKQPEIRFPGFMDDWEQRKLKEISTYIRGSFPQPYTNLEFYDEKNGKPFVQVADIGFDLKLNSDTKAHISKLAEPKSRFVKAGKVVVALQGSIEKSIGRTAITQYDAYFDRTILIFEEYKIPIDKIYFAQIIKKLFEHEKEKAWGATISTITKAHLNDFIIGVPSIEEQQKIGTFFKQLDDTIALHQRKLDLLKETKKGFLQKMFPKNGAKVPEIRFPGFTEDWEQRKVGDFLNESRIKGSDGSVARKMTVKLWRKGVVPKEEIYSGSSATQYYIRKSGQFMYGKLDFLNQAFGIVPSELDGYESTLDSPAFDIGENMNSIFLLEYVSLTRFYKYQGNLANGSRRAKRIHVDTFLEMPIPTPSFEEQTKIGGFFKQLDDTITLHQRKLDLLKETKKGFLQKMFV
ncbi:restriction endonuclease subunit S [Enterococcus faecium]|uniref:restriction endonuclease subunit S n=1 Tax=Enterococcus faecium TaxID=1352 RepID=UPI00100E96D4|nr:restriction endonuclease subunit S [Enterococcus faecium]MBD9752584.1 restriction endonuclease subunit S [Enterococcus faecium]RXW89100.1 restriction endonuclease subunit S [Enterococcus faecium]RXW93519.1 restriction endonuclease subunit S [Enterococcus faecium]